MLTINLPDVDQLLHGGCQVFPGDAPGQRRHAGVAGRPQTRRAVLRRAVAEEKKEYGELWPDDGEDVSIRIASSS